MGDLMSEEEFFQFCQMNDTLEVRKGLAWKYYSYVSDRIIYGWI